MRADDDQIRPDLRRQVANFIGGRARNDMLLDRIRICSKLGQEVSEILVFAAERAIPRRTTAPEFVVFENLDTVHAAARFQVPQRVPEREQTEGRAIDADDDGLRVLVHMRAPLQSSYRFTRPEGGKPCSEAQGQAGSEPDLHVLGANVAECSDALRDARHEVPARTASRTQREPRAGATSRFARVDTRLAC